MNAVMDRATQARRYDAAAVLLDTDRARAVSQIRAMPAAERQHLQGQVDWVIAYEDFEDAE